MEKKFLRLISGILLAVLILLPQSVSAEPKGISLLRAKEISAGQNFSVALAEDGTVWSWGDNIYGQLGNGNQIDQSAPVKVKGLDGVTKIAAGGNHALALKDDGTLWAWGWNMNGQLGNNCSTFYSSEPVEIDGLKDIISIKAGDNHSVALKSDGTVWVWGRNAEGQFGNGKSGGQNSIPTQVNRLNNIIFISSIGDYIVALKDDGVCYAWGHIVNKAYSYQPITLPAIDNIEVLAAGRVHIVAKQKSGRVYMWTDISKAAQRLSELEGIKEVAAGQYHAAALGQDGRVWSWGTYYNTSHSISVLAVAEGSPSLVKNLNNIKSISSGYNHTITLRKDGVILSWGNDKNGQLGNGTRILNCNPIKVNGLTDVSGIAAKGDHSMALTNSGKVNIWGETLSVSSKIGLYKSTGAELQDITSVKEISASTGNGFVLKNDGTVWRWGVNVGDYPRKIDTLNEILSVSGKESFSAIALKSDGSVWEWDEGGRKFPPQKVADISEVIAVAGGRGHSLALKRDGTVWSWGFNKYGQLGNGTYNTSDIPTKVNGLENVVAISCGPYYSMALKSDGSVWTWGFNDDGNLGDGTYFNSSIPKKVSSLDNVIAISGGYKSATALKSDGSVWSWGSNRFGQLGNGTFIDSLYPVRANCEEKIKEISAGSDHTLALTEDGTVLAWGSNCEGQLGDGVILFQSEPVHSMLYVQKDNQTSDIIKVKLNGKQLIFNVLPVNVNNRILVPLRAIFESLGVEVFWDEKTQTVTGKKGNDKIVLQINNKSAIVNGEEKILDVPGIIIDGTTLVPTRFIAESVGVKVEWNENTNTVRLTSN